MHDFIFLTIKQLRHTNNGGSSSPPRVACTSAGCCAAMVPMDLALMARLQVGNARLADPA